MRTMEFKNMVHNTRPILNMTVRRGPKWSDLKTDEQIMLKGNDTILPAVVVSALVMRFELIPSILIQYEHDPSCRSREGLLNAMRAVYEGFVPEEEVTLVLYYLK